MNICVSTIERPAPRQRTRSPVSGRGGANGNKPSPFTLIFVNCDSSHLTDLKPFLVHLMVCDRFNTSWNMQLRRAGSHGMSVRPDLLTASAAHDQSVTRQWARRTPWSFAYTFDTSHDPLSHLALI